MTRMVMDKLWPLLTGLAVLIAGAIALQLYAQRRGNEAIRVVIQDETGAGGGEEDGGEAAPVAEGEETPPRSEAHAQARLLARRAEFDKALPLFEQEATARPDDAGLASEYGAWLAAADQAERALAWLVKADQLRPTAQTALALGELRARLGDRAGAEADLRRVIALRPTSNPARVTLGELLLKKGERAEAVTLLEGACTTGSNEERAHALVTLGGAYLLTGKRAEAEKAFDKAVLFAPARPDVRLGVARAWLAMDSKEDVRRALPILARTVEIAPDVPAVFAAVGRARERLGEDAAAAEAYDRALRLDPSFRYARRRLLRLALGNRDFARARREAERLVADAPAVPEHHFLMALVAERDGRRDDARKAYRAAIDAAKGDYPEAYLNLGVLERNANDFEAARQAYDKALEQRPKYPAAWLNIGKLLEAQGKPAEAEEAYRRALAIEPRHANGQMYLGQLLADLKRWDEAEQALRASLEAKPGNTAAQLSLGVVYATSGRLDQAVATYQQVLQVNPRMVPALYDLALALEKQGKAGEARRALQQALEADPGHVGALRELAELELGARRLPEARRAWQDLLDAAPGDVPARAALAELSALEGDQRGCETAARALEREAPGDAAVRALSGRCAAAGVPVTPTSVTR